MRAGKVAVSTKLNLDDPRAAEIAAMFGFDCIWIDLEHVPSSMANDIIYFPPSYYSGTIYQTSRLYL